MKKVGFVRLNSLRVCTAISQFQPISNSCPPFSRYFLGAQSGSEGGGGGGRSTGALDPFRLLSRAFKMSSGLKGAGPGGSLDFGFGAVGWVAGGVVFLGPAQYM